MTVGMCEQAVNAFVKVQLSLAYNKLYHFVQNSYMNSHT